METKIFREISKHKNITRRTLQMKFKIKSHNTFNKYIRSLLEKDLIVYEVGKQWRRHYSINKEEVEESINEFKDDGKEIVWDEL